MREELFWQLPPVVLGGALTAALALAAVMIAGFVRPARKVVSSHEILLDAGTLIRDAFSFLTRARGSALRIGLLGAVAIMAVEAAAYTVLELTLVANILWIVINGAMVFYWHRQILGDEARAAGFDTDRARLLVLLGRSVLVSLLLFLPLFLIGLFVGFAATGGRSPPLQYGFGGLMGLAAIAAIVWYSRFVLTFPATAIHQPDGAGVFDMHKRGEGLGPALTAALGVVLLPLTGPQIVQAFAAEAEIALRDAGPATPLTVVSDFLVYVVPVAVLVAVQTLLCVSIVSAAYRRWILPEYQAPAASAVGAL